MRNLKLIIFDLDGTLIDAYPAIINSVNYTLRKLHYPKQDPLVIKKSVGWGDKNLLEPFVSAHDLKKALNLYRKYHKTALLKGSRLFPGVKGVLEHLKKKGYKLAVASNRPTRFSLILIRHLGIKRNFDYVLCADKLRRGKPYPDILNKIMQRFHCSPRESLYVGDMVIDVQAGRGAKVKTIIVSTGSSTPKEIKHEKPYRAISKIKDLLKLF
jgi:phosphoglycolate phosphatase